MKPAEDEVEFVAQAILDKVYQGDEAKLEACRHIARVAVRAHWEWGDQTTVPVVDLIREIRKVAREDGDDSSD